MDDQESYDVLAGVSGSVWNSITSGQKDALVGYTREEHTDINRWLKGGGFFYKQQAEFAREQTDLITSAIEQSSYNRTVVLRRGVDNESSVFGFSVSNASPEQLRTLVGNSYTMKQFGSYGASEGAGFDGRAEIILKAPKGTKMIYAEPFSANGLGEGRTWDGKTRQKYISGENEVIMQRGTTYRVDKVETVYGKNRIYATVIRQQKF